MVRLDSSLEYISKARKIGGFGDNFVAGLSGLVVFVFTALTGIGESVANLFIAPTDATTGGIVALIGATLEAPARFLQSAWNTAAVQLGMGPWRTLGPFIVLVAVIVVLMVLGLVAWYLDQFDMDALGGWEVPWLDRDTGGDVDDEN
jgi:hypothetical protein